MGQQSNAKHNEFVLMAGSLGISSLVCLLNNGNNGTTETTQSVLGPFWRLYQPTTPQGGTLVRPQTPGPCLYVDLKFIDSNNNPINDLIVDIWHASPGGHYENQDGSQTE